MATKKTKKDQEQLDVSEFKRHDADTGSPEVQVRLLTEEVIELQKHLQSHKKDYDAKRSLLKKVAKRRKFLKYLKDTKLDNYSKVSKQLDLKV